MSPEAAAHALSPAPARALAGDSPWPRRIAIINDYVRVPYANGSSFASQRFYREFVRRGHEVTVIGPTDPASAPQDLPRRHLLLPSLPLRNHPGVRMPFPSRPALAAAARASFDVVLGQTGSELAELGAWLRAQHAVPFLCVNTIHLPSVYDVVLPESWHRNTRVQSLFRHRIVPWLERHSVDVYNRSDGLIVLSRGLERYWRQRGVAAPIHVIPRSIDVGIFDGPGGADPFSARAPKGERLLVICRHTREKELARLLAVFATRIAPRRPSATLTLVGDGPDHDEFRALARRLGVADRTFFPGECPATQTPDWYRHADLFVYMSQSETYGQVIGEALWCGLPVVALADDMGVSHQVDHGETGVLVRSAGASRTADDEADAEFAAAVGRLLDRPDERRALGQAGRRRARERAAPERGIEAMYRAFESARVHRASSPAAAPGGTSSARRLVRWRAVHALACLFGLLRRPATLNRNNSQHPAWDEDGQDGHGVEDGNLRPHAPARPIRGWFAAAASDGAAE